MTGDEGITDLDLMAYADGLFVADCARRRRLEKHLTDCPDDAARVADYRVQNAAICSAYEHLLARRVPERIERLFIEPDRPPAAALLRRAAATVLVAGIAAAAGWHASDALDSSAADSAESLARLAATYIAGSPLAVAGVSEATVRPHHAEEARIMIELAPPDLTAQQLVLTKVERVSDADGAALHLSYADKAGKAVSLFLRPTLHAKPPHIRLREQAGVAVASWRIGPLAVALAAERGAADLERLATKFEAAVSNSLSPDVPVPRMAGHPLPPSRSQRGGEIMEPVPPDSIQLPKVN